MLLDGEHHNKRGCGERKNTNGFQKRIGRKNCKSKRFVELNVNRKMDSIQTSV